MWPDSSGSPRRRRALSRRAISSYVDYEKSFGGLVVGGCLPQAVAGYFANGGRDAFIVSAGTLPSATIPAVAPGAAPAPPAGLPAAQDLAGFSVQPTKSIDPGKDVTVKLAPDEGADTFTVTVSRPGETDETFEKLTLKSGAKFIATAVTKDSKLVKIDAPAEVPAAIAASARSPSSPSHRVRSSPAGPASRPFPLTFPDAACCSAATKATVPGSVGWPQWTRSPWCACPT